MAEKTLKELRQDKQRFWRVHIRAWETSGFSQNEYCRRNKLRTNQFTYWKTKFKQSPSGQVSFVPVPIRPTHTVEQSFESNDSGVSVWQLPRYSHLRCGNINVEIHLKRVMHDLLLTA